MSFCLSLPLEIAGFWYIEAPHAILNYIISLNSAIVQMFSLPLLIKSFFKPWKNEYRKGLVGFSIGMGMFIKTFVILSEIILFSLLLTFELLFFAVFLFWPVGTILILIYL